MPKPFYITTAIPYVNGAPHIGFAMEIIEADALARYHRLLGEDVYFLTGTDEHGNKMVQTAAKEGITARELANRNSKKFQDLMKVLNITNNQFIRTTDKTLHWKGAQKLWKKLESNGDIYKAPYEGLYCVGCESFKLEKDLVNGLCPDHQKAPEVVRDENYFFRLSKYTKRIAKLIESQKLHIIPEFRANEILALCDDGLQDVSFSRSTKQLKWGIPVPGDSSQVMYVWCDALSNYITALGYASNSPKFKKYWPASIQIIGKDILRFHAAIWIGMLMSAGLQPPTSELVHGWIHVRGEKMSKSKGNLIDPFVLSNHYGVDALRYWMLSEIPMGSDGDFTFEQFESKINADLANNLGNLVNRVFHMTEKYLNSKVPVVKTTIPSKIRDAWRTYHGAMKSGLLHNACQSMMSLVDFANKFIDESKPWVLAKEGQTKQLEKDMRVLLKTILHLAFMLEPICPSKAQHILESFGLSNYLNAKGLNLLEKNTLLTRVKKIKRGGLLFERIDESKSLAVSE